MATKRTGAKRPLTEAQKAHLERLNGKRPGRAAEPPSAGAVAVLERLTETLPAKDDLLTQFADFARILGDESTKKAERNKTIDQLEGLLGSMSAKDYPELAEHPVVERFVQMIIERKAETGVLKPGQVVGTGLNAEKVEWRFSDLTEWVDYTPRETVPVTYNGLQIWFIEDVPMRVPKAHVDVYEESRRLQRGAREHRDMLFKPRLEKRADDGVPSDPSILAGFQGQRSRMLRGAFSGGMFDPGKGMTIEVPEGDRPGADELGEGEGEAA